MKTLKVLPLIAFFCLFNLHHALSQTVKDSIQYKVETVDGNEFIGQILSQDSTVVNLKTEKLGTLSIKRKDITSLKQISALKSKDGAYWFENPQATHYLTSGNGYGLKKGEAYYQNAWILFNHFNVGITNNFSIGAGLFPTFLFASSNVPVWLTPKVTFPIKENQINIGVGALLGTVAGVDKSSFGIVYGVSTFGSRDKNISIGLGYGYLDGDFSKKPMISVSGLIRTGPRGYIITDNYMFQAGSQTNFIFSLGGRRLIKRVGLDYGLFVPVYKQMTDFIAIPWLGLIIPLGK